MSHKEIYILNNSKIYTQKMNRKWLWPWDAEYLLLLTDRTHFHANYTERKNIMELISGQHLNEWIFNHLISYKIAFAQMKMRFLSGFFGIFWKDSNLWSFIQSFRSIFGRFSSIRFTSDDVILFSNDLLARNVWIEKVFGEMCSAKFNVFCQICEGKIH